MEAAKTGQSVQTIASSSEALAEEMDSGRVNVVALNSDGTHEFRHANAAEMQRMAALRSADEEGFAGRFNDLHKGQFQMSDAGWVKENGVMREANDFEQNIVNRHGAATFNQAFGREEGFGGMGYVQQPTMQQRLGETRAQRQARTDEVRENVKSAARQVGAAGRGVGRTMSGARRREAEESREGTLARLNVNYAAQATRSGSESMIQRAAS